MGWKVFENSRVDPVAESGRKSAGGKRSRDLPERDQFVAVEYAEGGEEQQNRQ